MHTLFRGRGGLERERGDGWLYQSDRWETKAWRGPHWLNVHHKVKCLEGGLASTTDQQPECLRRASPDSGSDPYLGLDQAPFVRL